VHHLARKVLLAAVTINLSFPTREEPRMSRLWRYGSILTLAILVVFIAAG